ncbi:putative myb transcription protein [Eutypa lata UCREL1]|uniref:Putative myb transcription protein n=1 Tax=Eutypa lata (strain UCR-EL1) TaxID=1287681 RepID=M7TXW6_EUTLA|nr:putative myb transcription protein [Eutypa lata UCREL1]
MGGAERRAPKRWTEEEDKILWEETRKQSKSGNVKDWNRIAAKLPNRTNKDCRKRWVNTLSGSLKKGAWSEDEDERLIAAVNSHGQKWTLVASMVGLRSPDQCSKRWQHNLDPKLEHRGWTQAEDELLLESVEKHGREWKLIQELSYNTRSRNDLKNRYSILTRRRDSLSAQGAQRRANSPSTSGSSSTSTPGRVHEESLEFKADPEDLLMQDPDTGEYAQDPAYDWGNGTMDDNWFNSTHIGPDSYLDSTNPDLDLAAIFSSTEGTIVDEGEYNTDQLYDASANAAPQQFPWEGLGTGEEALFGDLADLHIPPGTGIDTPDTAQNSIAQASETFGEISMRRRVSLVVDECDWSTLNYLMDVSKPLKGKVKLEMNF